MPDQVLIGADLQKIIGHSSLVQSVTASAPCPINHVRHHLSGAVLLQSQYLAGCSYSQDQDNPGWNYQGPKLLSCDVRVPTDIYRYILSWTIYHFYALKLPVAGCQMHGHTL